MGTLASIHVTSAVISIVLGALVLLDAKGTLAHRALGVAYVLAMLMVNLSTLGLYRLLGTFGPFHVLALISFVVLLIGMIPLFRRKKNWLQLHYRFMCGSYVGLLAAATAEAMIRIPAIRNLFQSPQQVIWVSIGIAVTYSVAARLVLPRLEQRVLARV